MFESFCAFWKQHFPEYFDGCSVLEDDTDIDVSPVSCVICTFTPSDENIDIIYRKLCEGGMLLVKSVSKMIEKPFFDFSYYEGNMFVGVKPGDKACYLPQFPATPCRARKRDRKLLYILCPMLEAFEDAKKRYEEVLWARPILIPTTYYLENVMFDRLLRIRAREWQFAGHVGCVAWRAHEKFDVNLLHSPFPDNADVVAFVYRGDPLIQTAARWHPRFEEVWLPCMDALGYGRHQSMSDSIPSFYCNYWAASPSWMWRYIAEFARLKRCLESMENIQEPLWSDSTYTSRGGDIARQSLDSCVRSWGVPFYPYHPFICERYPCLFFWSQGARLGILHK